MFPNPSVTTWVKLLCAGDTGAAQPLWERYFTQLVRLAHDHLAARLRPKVDPEDVALSAFASFCLGAAAGRFPRLEDRHDLWRLLFTLTLRHTADHARRAGRLRRGGDLLELSEADLDRLSSEEPDPAWAAAVADELRRLLDLLPGDDLRLLVQARLEGRTFPEIAEQLGGSLRTVERKWQLVREFWLEQADR
jgi:DNA-directed RNA polymerase specialized sigma24 family protein